MKKFLLTLLTIILIVGVLGGVGFAGYRFGYAQGRRTASTTAKVQPQPQAPNNNVRPFPNMPFGPGMNRGFGQHGFNFGFGPRGFNRGFGPGGFGMMPFGRGFGFFGIFGMLL